MYFIMLITSQLSFCWHLYRSPWQEDHAPLVNMQNGSQSNEKIFHLLLILTVAYG